MVAALQHDLRRAEVDGLAAALDDVFDAAHPALFGLRRPVEGAEAAGGHADVGVVDVAVDQVSGDVLGAGEAAPAYRVSSLAQFVEGGLLIERERLGGVDPSACGSVVQHIGKAHTLDGTEAPTACAPALGEHWHTGYKISYGPGFDRRDYERCR